MLHGSMAYAICGTYKCTGAHVDGMMTPPDIQHANTIGTIANADREWGMMMPRWPISTCIIFIVVVNQASPEMGRHLRIATLPRRINARSSRPTARSMVTNTTSHRVMVDSNYDLELAKHDGKDTLTMGDGGGEIWRGEKLVYQSSLAIRGLSIRLPANNVWLVCNPWLQPGILLSKARDVPGKSKNDIVGHEGCNNSKYGNFHGSRGSGSVHANPPLRRPIDPLLALLLLLLSHYGEGGKRTKGSRDANLQHRHLHSHNCCDLSKEGNSRQQGLAYVLTCDMRIYQCIVQEMSDSYCLTCRMYYCWYGASQSGAQSNTFNLILRLCCRAFFTYEDPDWGVTSCETTQKTQMTFQIPSPWWQSRLPLQRCWFNKSTPPEGWVALQMHFPWPLLKSFVRINKLM